MDPCCARPGRVGRRGASVSPGRPSARTTPAPRLAPWPPTGSRTRPRSPPHGWAQGAGPWTCCAPV